MLRQTLPKARTRCRIIVREASTTISPAFRLFHGGGEGVANPVAFSRRLRSRSEVRVVAAPRVCCWRATRRTLTTDVSNYADTDKFTRVLLNGRQRPLGTLTWQQWEDSLAALDFWLSCVGAEVDHSEQQSSGYAIDAADRLCQRLLVESATKSVLSRHFATSLSPYILSVVDGWLIVSELHPHSVLAVERAQEAWNRVLVSGYSEEATDEAFARLVQAWVRLESRLDGALNALLSANIGRIHDPSLCQALAQCYHEVYQSARLSRHPDTDLLKERMVQLGSQPRWKSLIEIQESIDEKCKELLTDYQSLPSSEKPTGKKLSAFEAERLQQGLLRAVQNSGDGDSINDIIAQWEESSPSEEANLLFAEAVFSFFLRCNDAKAAGTWLQRLSVHENSNSQSATAQIERISALIKVWGATKDFGQAPWRVDELLRQLESLALATSHPVDTDVYTIAAGLWLKHADKDGQTSSRKALDIVQRAPSQNASLVHVAMSALLKDDRPSPSIVEKVLVLLEDQWDNIPEDRLLSYTEAAARVLASSKLSSRALPFLELVEAKGMLSDESTASTVCHCIVQSFSDSTNPNDILQLFDALESSGIVVSFEDYKTGVETLIEMRHNRRIKQILELLSRLMEGVHSNRIDADVTSVGDLLMTAMDVLTYFQREVDALSLLNTAEAKLASIQSGESPIPLAMYKKVMALLLAKDEVQGVEDIFHRIKSKYDDGAADFLPDKDVYNMYIVSLSKHGDNLEKQEALLKELIGLYETTGNDAFKPLDRSFNKILSGMVKEASNKNIVDRMNFFVDRMISLQVAVTDSYGFNAAMQILLRQSRVDPFPAVLEILDRMEESVAPDEFTLHNVLTACGRARPSDREKALVTLTDSLRKIRAMGKVEAKTYPWALRSLARLLFETNDPRGVELTKALFHLCCQDGFLNEQTKTQIQALLGKEKWDELYSRQTAQGNEEPLEWSRRSQHA